LYVSELCLKNFRNYSSAKIRFSSAVNIIYGNNAQGKTNLLEAIYLCSTGRSHRTYKDSEIIGFNAEVLKVTLKLCKKNRGEIKIETEINSAGKKGVCINGSPIKKIGEMLGYLNVVMFSPEDIRFVREEPQMRRRFLDIFISQIRPSYFFNVQQYIKILRQRNALLRQIRENAKLSEMLDAWNTSLSSIGARIMKERQLILKSLDEYAKENHRKLTKRGEILRLAYLPSVKAGDAEDTNSIEQCFLQALRKSTDNDLTRLYTQYGPHRDDISMHINGKDLKMYGSQGQQRTCALALKLAQVDVMEEECGDTPILLLDDVMSELDSGRRENLISDMKKAQTFLTGTDREILCNISSQKATFFHVDSGTVTETS